MTRRFLFVAVTSGAMGELTMGRGLALGLQERGHSVTFLAPAEVAALFTGTGIEHRPIDALLPRMAEALPRFLRSHPCDLVVLVDLTSVFLGLESAWAQDSSFLCDLPRPVFAIDFWDVAATDMRWDFGPEALEIPRRALEIPRLVPVPFVPPRGDGVYYNALPSLAAPAADARAPLRRELGLEDGDELVLMLSSRWQVPEAQLWKHHRRLAEHVPALALAGLTALGPRVHVAHVGPRPFAGAEALGARYHWLSQLPPERFAAVAGCADLLLSFATSSAAAFNCLVQGVPILLAINSRRGRSVDEVMSQLPGPSPAIRAWLERVVPLYPYRLWPLGLYDMLTPAMRDNPFADAIDTVELLDGEALIEGCRRLLFDADAREAARRRQSAYVERVRALPLAADALLARL